MVFLSSGKQHVVRKFLGLISSHNIPVYLIDPLILGLVDKDMEQIRSSPGGPSPQCRYFCAPRDFTTFALLDKTWKHERGLWIHFVVTFQAEETLFSSRSSPGAGLDALGVS
ncbi:hypothetical protein WISP_00138 [Willisornis vidua]|uniref:Ribitol-5-phosphate transferase FKTN N-terminal domain-containing protein n=1 Tax=Willisornis vidua TaxID=1566151 RepID=A0ABQ9CJN4_9PASS|nr:hypothetical protein WISP_00138 [Willisornis vidua]